MSRLAYLLLVLAVAAAPASAEWAPVADVPVEVAEMSGDEATAALDGDAVAARAPATPESGHAVRAHGAVEAPESPPPER